MIGLSVMDTSINSIHLEIPATLRHLSVACACLVAYCDRMQLPPSAAFVNAMELAMQEACTNIVRHAYRGEPGETIEVAISATANRLTVEIRDRGESFDPSKVPPPDFAIAQEHGFGLYLIKTLVDCVEYESRGEWNRLRLTKRIEG